MRIAIGPMRSMLAVGWFAATAMACTDVSVPTDTGTDMGALDAPIDAPDDSHTIDDLASADAGCPTGTMDCNGACADLATDPVHCGTCGNDCTQLPGAAATIRCIAGHCDLATGCVPGRAHCSTDPTTGCETDLWSAQHCGSCTTQCTGATPVCAPLSDPTQFGCATGCMGGQTLCGTACVSVVSDRANCGSCGHACATNEMCTNGMCTRICPPVAPVAALNASPLASNACNVNNVLAADGMEAGLDYGPFSVTRSIGGQVVTSCVAADFGAVFDIGSAIVRARPVPLACSTPCSSLACNTGDSFLVFAGASMATLTYLQTVSMLPRSPLTDYTVGCNFSARYVVVCRGSQTYTRDDVMVDAISTRCMCP